MLGIIDFKGKLLEQIYPAHPPCPALPILRLLCMREQFIERNALR
jgi:hypothetical protein